MKVKKSIWRTLELLMASTFGGIIGFFITKFYETNHILYFVGTAIMIGIIGIFVFSFNIFRPDE